MKLEANENGAPMIVSFVFIADRKVNRISRSFVRERTEKCVHDPLNIDAIGNHN